MQTTRCDRCLVEKAASGFYAAYPSTCRSCIKAAGAPARFTCTRCRHEFPTAEKASGKGTCLPCRRATHRERNAALAPEERAANAAYAKRWREARPDYGRARGLAENYSITVERYDALLVEQGGRCAICKTDTPGNKRQRYFHVDHDHASGEVRGLLCGPCNVGLGMFRDSPDLLTAAAAYLGSSA